MNGTDTASEARPVPSPRSGRIARSVLRGAGIILIVTVFARIAGFVRYLVFGASVGAGDVGTAYTTANMLPNVLFEIVAGGALAAAVSQPLLGSVGMAIAVLSGLASALASLDPFTGLWLILADLALSTVLVFDIGVYLAVFGAILTLVFALEETL